LKQTNTQTNKTRCTMYIASLSSFNCINKLLSLLLLFPHDTSTLHTHIVYMPRFKSELVYVFWSWNMI